MEIVNTFFEAVKIIKLRPFEDHRGFWMRTYDESIFKFYGVPTSWVQENHSKSMLKGTIRGLHFILPPHTDAKLIRCIKGRIMDVIVDLRKGSKTFGVCEKFELNENEHNWLYIPKGFAHGFCTLEDNTEMIYKHDSFYQKDFDSGIKWNDPDLAINWPVNTPIISEKDNKLMSMSDFIKDFGGLI